MTVRSLILATWSLLLSLATLLPARSDEAAYVGVTRSGKRLAINSLESWPLIDRGAAVDGKPLFGDDPLLWISDPRGERRLQPPYLEMSNGDVLPGGIDSFAPVDRGRGVKEILLVAPSDPLRTAHSGFLPVRFDRMLRYVNSTKWKAKRPGELVAMDGRTFQPRSVRCRKYDVALLTDEGRITLPWTEIADWWIADSPRNLALLADSQMIDDRGLGLLVRASTRSGAVVTSGLIEREEVVLERNKKNKTPHFTFQPSWSLRSIGIPEEGLVECSFRRRDELPLSLLDTGTLKREAVLVEGPALVRNATTLGERPRLGVLSGDLGVGTRTSSELTFCLPPGAKSFTAWTGIDGSVGRGGCVLCRVHGDSADNEPLWSSGFLTSTQPPEKIGPLELDDVESLVLVSDMAHQGRPVGADPLDIRDETFWLMPLVTCDLSKAMRSSEAVAALLPGTERCTWNGAAPKIEPTWNRVSQRREPLLKWNGKGHELTRKITVEPNEDILELAIGALGDPRRYDFIATVEGKPLPRMTSDPVERVAIVLEQLAKRRDREFDGEFPCGDHLVTWWDLQEYRGKEIEVRLQLNGSAGEGSFYWRGMTLRGAVAEIPSGGIPKPLVSLSTIKDMEFISPSERANPTYGTLPANRGKKITYLGQEWSDGYGMIRDSSLTVKLAPNYRRFTAVVGSCVDSVGPLVIRIDERIVWQRDRMLNVDPAECVSVDIPEGAKRLTLETGSKTSYSGTAAWTVAGFHLSKGEE